MHITGYLHRRWDRLNVALLQKYVTNQVAELLCGVGGALIGKRHKRKKCSQNRVLIALPSVHSPADTCSSSQSRSICPDPLTFSNLPTNGALPYLPYLPISGKPLNRLSTIDAHRNFKKKLPFKSINLFNSKMFCLFWISNSGGNFWNFGDTDWSTNR